MGSKQANEINNKESKADPTENGKGKSKIDFSCVRSRKRRVQITQIPEAKESTKKREKWREGNQHPWNSEKRSEQQKQCE